MLADAKLVAFLATTNAERTRAFFQDTLGLRLESDDDFALVFDANGTSLRIAKVQEVSLAPYTVLGWHVADVRATVVALTAKGVVFERFEGMGQDADGIWSPGGGQGVAWFKDPEGQLLSVSG
ncbi:glyoxalase [bacterium SCGC AG-212-C10]|nr:glyoxalase [bacterium SCGC AG-212-C10]